MSLFASTSDRLCHSLRALAWLLRYPDDGLRAVAPQLGAALRAEARWPPAASTSSTR